MSPVTKARVFLGRIIEEFLFTDSTGDIDFSIDADLADDLVDYTVDFLESIGYTVKEKD